MRNLRLLLSCVGGCLLGFIGLSLPARAQQLAAGEWKSVTNERVILSLGPEQELGVANESGAAADGAEASTASMREAADILASRRRS